MKVEFTKDFSDLKEIFQTRIFIKNYELDRCGLILVTLIHI